MRIGTIQDKDRDIKVIAKLRGALKDINLCLICKNYKPGKEDNCGIAAEVDELGAKGVIVPVVGCVEFQQE